MRQIFHTFRAESLDAAYSAMRRKLGEDAIVLRTATVPAGGVWNTLVGRKIYEITASGTEPVVPRRTRSPIENKYLSATSDAPIASDERVEETLDYFRKLAELTEARKQQNKPEETPTQPEPTAGTYSPKRQAPSGRVTPPIPQGNAEPVEVIQFERPDANLIPQNSATMDDLRSELNDMREMLQVMSAEAPGAGLPQEFAPQYQMLRERGVTKKRAAALVSTAARRGDLRAFRDPRVFIERLKMEVRKSLRVTGGTALEAGERKVIALIGPTGVGKTTNLAKLAALFAVHEHARVGIITTDTYRVGATDQLRVYANIIDLDMKVVDDPADMKSALRKFEAKDLVLIDTAGGSPFNAEQMADAGQMLAVAQPHETHLLLSAATNLDDLRSIVSHFSVLKPSALFFSKLDETHRYGGLYSLAAESGLPLSYFSLGQQVPDDIQTVTQGVVANLLLEGTESRGGTGTKSS